MARGVSNLGDEDEDDDDSEDEDDEEDEDGNNECPSRPRTMMMRCVF